MESIFTKLALYGSKNDCARTDNDFSPISEVCDGTVCLVTFPHGGPAKKIMTVFVCFLKHPIDHIIHIVKRSCGPLPFKA